MELKDVQEEIKNPGGAIKLSLTPAEALRWYYYLQEPQVTIKYRSQKQEIRQRNKKQIAKDYLNRKYGRGR